MPFSHEKVSIVDCLVPLYLHKESGEHRPSLRRSSVALVLQTAHHLRGVTICLGIHATQRDAENVARTIRTFMGQEVEVSQLPDGFFATLFTILDILHPSGSDITRAVETGLSSRILISDYRPSEAPSDVITSAELTHKELIILLDDDGRRKSMCKMARAEELLSGIESELQDENMVRHVISDVMAMPGAPTIFSSGCVSDVLDNLDDLSDGEISFNTPENRRYIQRRLEEESFSPELHSMTDAIIAKISCEILHDIRKPVTAIAT